VKDQEREKVVSFQGNEKEGKNEILKREGEVGLIRLDLGRCSLE
jgi:hypothetical protein